MAFGQGARLKAEEDDLSSISCISRHLLLDDNPLLIVKDEDAQEQFENEFNAPPLKEQSSRPFSPISEGNNTRPSALPTELFLPTEWSNKRSHPSTTSTASLTWFKIPYLKEYPPVLRMLFILCFVCIVCAIGLILFAVVVETRENSNTPTPARGGFDLDTWNKGSTGTTPTPPHGTDIFVEEGEEGGNHYAPVNSPAPSMALPLGSTRRPSATAPPITPIYYTPAPTRLPQVFMAKKKQMGMNANDDKEKDDEDDDDDDGDDETGEKDDDRRKRKRQRRRAKEMMPSLYPSR